MSETTRSAYTDTAETVRSFSNINTEATPSHRLITSIDIKVLRQRITDKLSQKCLFLEKYKEYPRDFHHMTLIATLPWTKVLVRIHRHSPNSKNFPATNMASEAATMKYVAEHTRIPVPEVWAYDPDEDGCVGGEWMVSEYVKGIPLLRLWHKMGYDEHMAIAESLADIWSQLLGLRFSKIGSLYEDGKGSPVGPITSMPLQNRLYDKQDSMGSSSEDGIRKTPNDIDEDGKGTIHPMTLMSLNDKLYRKKGSPDSIPKDVRTMRPPDPKKCGPFTSVRAWLTAVAKRELDWDPERFLESSPENSWKNNTLHNITDSPIFDDPESQRLSHISLEHVDMHLDHILVNPKNVTEIVGVIAWEGARAVPMWAIRPQILFDPCSLINNKENVDWQTFIRNEIKTRVKIWYEATHEEGADLRALLARAKFSTWNAADVKLS